MNLLAKLLTITAMVAFLEYANAEVATKLIKGQRAPFTGVLITEDKVIDLYKKEQKNIVLEDLKIDQEQLIDKYKVHTKDLEKKLDNSKSNVFWSRVGFFILGAIVYRGVSK